ncbi:hypothetical protein NHL50_09410 [Acidimicrobiia bacterium EGI L10123]|uniref:hypothetical protein n=1 Tax=Salinilacustrithrix flava TaxID=2957203 RepID=UPI003D7C1AA7|nr:hypothetical protein [Acidimicrobiia bacterium EGI L10123]
MSGLEAPEAPTGISRYTVSQASDGWQLCLDGSLIGRSRELQAIANRVLWSINQEVAARHHQVLVHAAAASLDGFAVVVPGSSGAGKSTLITALARAGWGYLTDEAVPFRADGLVEPYRKPLTLKPGSWRLFPELEPVTPEVRPPFTDTRWHVSPSVLGWSVEHRPATIRWIVFPERRSGASTEMRELSHGETVTELLRNCLNPAIIDQERLSDLASSVRGCAAVSLAFDDLASAVDAIETLARA